MRIKNKLLLTCILLLNCAYLFGQVDDDYEDSGDWERYARLELTNGEIISIAIGIVLLLIVKNIPVKYDIWRFVLGCAGVLFALPLVFVILALAAKVIFHVVMLAGFIGVLYFVFSKKK